MENNTLEFEDHRLKAHFKDVLGELRARDVGALSDAQRASRADVIGALEAYARRGLFPRNHDFPGAYTPYFVDAAGTRCAVAHLAEYTGESVLVEAIAARANNALVGALAQDPELGPGLDAWLAGVGLDVAEAARIQPAYCGMTVAACVCALNPVPAHVQAVRVDVDENGGIVGRVATVYGDTDLVVGDPIEFWAHRTDADSYLVALSEDGGQTSLVGAVFGARVEFTCGFGDGTPRPLLSDVSASWQSDMCHETMVARDSAAADSICRYSEGGADDSGCHGGAPVSLSLGTLGAFAWLLRRRRAQGHDDGAS